MKQSCVWFALVASFIFSLPSPAFEIIDSAPFETLNTHLFSLENSLTDEQTLDLLAMNSPRVLFLSRTHTEAIATAKLAIQMGSPVTLQWDPHTGIVSKVSMDSSDKPLKKSQMPRKWNYTPYTPSIIQSLNGARSLFNSVDSYTDSDLSDSCYSRAHYWARTFEVEQNIRSMKVFILFTPLYRSEHRFNWWYHVAPYVTVQNRDGEQQIVIDPSYEQAPKAIKDWVFHFASKARSCRVANSINQYYAEEALGGCVVVTGSMYAYTPQDLDVNRPLYQWRCEDLRDVQTNLRPPSNYGDWRNYQHFLPENCNQGLARWN